MVLNSELIFLHIVVIYSNRCLNIKWTFFNINHKALVNFMVVTFSYYILIFTYLTNLLYYYLVNIPFEFHLYLWIEVTWKTIFYVYSATFLFIVNHSYWLPTCTYIHVDHRTYMSKEARRHGRCLLRELPKSHIFLK